MWSNLQHLFSTYFSCSKPVSQRIIASPSGFQSIGLSQLIPQVHANHPRIVFVPLGQVFAVLKEFILRILITPPQAISVVIGAAPHR